MRTTLRRLRGVMTTALVWAVVWGLAGVALAAYEAAWHRYSLQATNAIVYAMFYAVVGAFSGMMFAIVLATVERRRTLEDLAIGRVARWGAIGGMILPVLTNVALLGTQSQGPNAVLCAMMGALGAGCAAGTLALARRPLAPS